MFADVPAYFISFSSGDGFSILFQIDNIIMKKDGKLYLLTFMSPQQLYFNNQPIGQNIFNTFKITHNPNPLCNAPLIGGLC
jgi:hypothetical protein